MNNEAKLMCLGVLHRLIDRKKLGSQKKLSKALGIPLAKAKDLLDNGDSFTQDEIIKFTAALVQYKQEG